MKHVFTIDNLADDRCFLCGDHLTDSNRTDEHVFPEWLLHRVGLWNQSLTLLNGTTIQYRQLTIPCCSECNNVHLGELENEMQAAFGEGYDAVLALHPMRIFQWCAKIWYGLLFKELSLRADRRDTALGSIMTPEALEQFQTHHIFLQSVRLPWLFHEFAPASVFVMKTHRYDVPQQNFDYIDNVITMNGDDPIRAPLLALRCEGVAVVCVFEDLGLTKEYFDGTLHYADGQTLHPYQFGEVACLLVSRHSLRRFSTHYTTGRVGATDAYWTRIARFPSGELWSPWNVELFKTIFQTYMDRIYVGHPLRFDSPGLVPSFLLKDGQRIVMNKDGSGSLQPLVKPSPIILPGGWRSQIIVPPRE